MSTKLKGTIYGVIAAVSYGTNPLGALYLYKEGLNVNSVLFYRFSLAAIILAGIMLVQKKSFAVTKKELGIYYLPLLLCPYSPVFTIWMPA